MTLYLAWRWVWICQTPYARYWAGIPIYVFLAPDAENSALHGVLGGMGGNGHFALGVYSTIHNSGAMVLAINYNIFKGRDWKLSYSDLNVFFDVFALIEL